MKILSLSDIVLDTVYSPTLRYRYGDVDMILGCGDMPYYYLEFVVDALNKPAFFVRGNHANVVEYSHRGERTAPHGAFDLHRKVVNHQGLLMAGIEGGIRYRPGPFMYTQGEMWMHVFSLIPGMLTNFLRYQRFLDVFVSHSPSWKIQDREDLPHQGIKAFRWLLMVFKPVLHLHGHIHLYRQDEPYFMNFGSTKIVNTYGARSTTLLHSEIQRRKNWHVG